MILLNNDKNTYLTSSTSLLATSDLGQADIALSIRSVTAALVIGWPQFRFKWEVMHDFNEVINLQKKLNNKLLIRFKRRLLTRIHCPPKDYAYVEWFVGGKWPLFGHIVQICTSRLKRTCYAILKRYFWVLKTKISKKAIYLPNKCSPSVLQK